MRLRIVEVQIRVDQQDAGEAPLPKDLPSLVAEMFPGLEQWDRDWPAVSDAERASSGCRPARQSARTDAEREDDVGFPLEASQLPLFRQFGTPEKDKKHVLFDGGHASLLTRSEMVKEALDWLDRYLGPVDVRAQ